MGVIYSIACRNCKVTRDLDKFKASEPQVKTRQDALDYVDVIQRESFRAALLVSFMVTHKNHDCVFFHEQSGMDEELDPFENEYGFKQDTDYWDST